MSRGPSTFKQQDVTRAVRAVNAAGREVRRLEMHRDGKIVLVMIEEPPLAEGKVEPQAHDEIVL